MEDMGCHTSSIVNMIPFAQLQNCWCYDGLNACAHVTSAYICDLEVSETAALTPLVVLAVLRISLHAVVQFHQDWLQARVHPLDQFVVHHQRPQQHAQD